MYAIDGILGHIYQYDLQGDLCGKSYALIDNYYSSNSWKFVWREHQKRPSSWEVLQCSFLARRWAADKTYPLRQCSSLCETDSADTSKTVGWRSRAHDCQIR